VRLSLFSRLTLGYLVLFLLVTGVSAYVIFQLYRFDGLTKSILTVDSRLLEYEKSLADLLLSQSRYEQKFTITKDNALFTEFLRLKQDFEAQIAGAFAVADARAKTLLTDIEADYQRYEKLVAEEAELLRRRREYAQGKFKEEKDSLIDAMLGSLEQLRADQQQAAYEKVEQLAQAADRARQIALFVTAACLVAIVLLSWVITRSVTRPIAVLKSRTREIAAGRFEGCPEVGSPPEIAELAAAFNVMCERLKELDRMKSDFYASMSHELRTPLTSIKEGTGLLLDGVGGETTEKQRKLLAILAEESNRLIGVVNSLLDLSKIEAGMMSYRFEPASVDPLIRQAIAEITPLAEAKQIRLESALDARLPTARLDRERILQVLRNLVGNAVKFTPKGGYVRVAARPVNGNLEVSVKDSGPGIPAESLTTIFDKFRQGTHNAGPTRQGTGLGLAIAKNIIASHGGKIWAESELGQGSTFIFLLPS
jgi:two-component system, NtrC family, sensor histidine kinase GlrK